MFFMIPLKMQKLQVPLRTCISCRRKAEKKHLVRVVACKDDVGAGEGLSGRGAYICRNLRCIAGALKGRRLAKALKGRIKNLGPDDFLRVIEEGGYRIDAKY